MSLEMATASAEGLYESVLDMLKSGENPNQYSHDGFTPLCLASFWGKSDIVKALINFGADVNLCNEGTKMTPLHAAAFQGQGKIIHVLLEYGADVNVKDKYGNSAADYASNNDAVWPLFANKGCKRRTEEQMRNKGLQHQDSEVHFDNAVCDEAMSDELEYTLQGEYRPRSAYINPLQSHHHASGDVLGLQHPPPVDNPLFNIWDK